MYLKTKHTKNDIVEKLVEVLFKVCLSRPPTFCIKVNVGFEVWFLVEL